VRGASPFSADKNHLHHRLLDIGLNQKQTVAVIAFYNIVIIASVFLLQGTNATLYLLLVAGFAIAIAQIPFFFTKVKNKVSDSDEA
ncbi:MAG: undecaprenyl/decaprenyl-phosphate alpha-N-acetylglucosaminyl 1-phosphate transferase, partial [Bacteroidetes bacterium]|nr:undecaprenyl/decaprenyl-phosphate alpha-N-acetylglucosaminyl 1-phosphate transferase [Bacteroidota bacterium]